MSESKYKLGLWKHFKKSIGKSAFYDSETGFETHPVWIFWALGCCAVWWNLVGIFG